MQDLIKKSLFTLSVISVGGLMACSNDPVSMEDEDPDAEITLSLFGADMHSQWDNMQSPVSEVVKEETGVTINAEFDVNGGDQKISLMAASGDYPDLIMPKGNASTLVDSGALLDLTDLIDEHAPNLKAIYGDYFDRLKWSNEDEAIYILATPPVDQTYWQPATGFMLQHDVVQELGYPDIRTVDDFEEAIRSYKELYPTIDGQPTIGLSLLADDWRILISTTDPAAFATGSTGDGEFYVNPDTYEAQLHYRRSEEKEYFRWLNHMNDEGLLDPESFVQKYDQYLAKISSGRILGLIDSDWQVGEAQRALREAGMQERMHGMYPVTLNEDFKHPNFQETGYLGGWGIGISVDCENPVRAIKFLDFLASDEGQILQNWGIEGEHYTIEDGKRVISEEEMTERDNNANYQKETGIGVMKGFAPAYGDGVEDSTGQTFTIASPEQIKESYTDAEKDVLAAYDAELWKDLYPQEDEFTPKPWGAAYNISVPSGSNLELILQRCLDITKRKVPEAILANPDDFDRVWDEFMSELESAGVDEAEKEYTELIKNRVELWGGS